MLLERAADESGQSIDPRRRQTQRLPDELWATVEQLPYLRQVVLPKAEQKLDGQRRILEEVDQRVDDAPLARQRFLVNSAISRLFEERDQLLELIEDQQRPVFARLVAELHKPRPELIGSQHDRRRVFDVGREAGRKKRVLVLGHRNSLDDEFLAAARLHTDAICPEALGLDCGNQARIDQGRLAGAGAAVEEDATVDDDELQQLACLELAGEEDRADRCTGRTRCPGTALAAQSMWRVQLR